MKYLLPLLFTTPILVAQTLSSHLNKNKIDLGELVVMKINISNLQGKEVISAPKNQLMPFHIEEIKDETTQNSQQYTRSITFTIYDEGKFSIPSLEFKIGDSIYKTIPYEIEVNNPAQQGEQINDIMPNQEIELSWTDYWELYKTYFFGALVLIGGILGFILLKKRTKNRQSTTVDARKKHLTLLKKLKAKNHIQNNEHRLFYIELLDISRKFLEEQYQIPAEILLTEDLLDFIKEKSITSPENQKILTEIFHRGDMVKFAKNIPDKDIMEQDFINIKNWIAE